MPKAVGRGWCQCRGPDDAARTSMQQQQLPLTEPFRVPGNVLTTLHTFLLCIFPKPSEVGSVIISTLPGRKLSLREECDGGREAGTCADRIGAQTVWLQSLTGLCSHYLGLTLSIQSWLQEVKRPPPPLAHSSQIVS